MNILGWLFAFLLIITPIILLVSEPEMDKKKFFDKSEEAFSEFLYEIDDGYCEEDE